MSEPTAAATHVNKNMEGFYILNATATSCFQAPPETKIVSIDLDRVQGHIHDSTLPGRQAFGFPRHVILQMASREVSHRNTLRHGVKQGKLS